MEGKIAHLEMIQEIITRMAANSFLIKGWSVTLVAALFALAAGGTNPRFIYLAYFPVVMFWALDGYFLRQERLFRKLYDSARGVAEDKTDFSLDTSAFVGQVEGSLRTCSSSTLLAFHGAVFATIVLVMFISM